jgi:hypothetical protein
MKINQKIVFLLSLFGISSITMTMYAQNATSATENEGGVFVNMTIFNSDNFFAADNVLAIQNGFTTVTNNANSLVLSAITAPPPPTTR